MPCWKGQQSCQQQAEELPACSDDHQLATRVQAHLGSGQADWIKGKSSSSCSLSHNRPPQMGHQREADLESTDASLSDKCCQVSSTETVAVGAGTHSLYIHVHRQGCLPCQGLQNGSSALRWGQWNIQNLVQPPRPAAHIAHNADTMCSNCDKCGKHDLVDTAHN